MIDPEQDGPVSDCDREAAVTPEKRPAILVVDDDPAFSKLVVDYLSSREYHVITADSGKTALSMLKKESVDILVLDAILGDFSGYKLCDWVRGKEEHYTPVILVSGLEGTEGKMKSLQVGADDYIQKPFDLNILELRIRNLLSLKTAYDRINELKRDLEKRNLELEILNDELREKNGQLGREKEQAERYRLSLADDLMRTDLLSRFSQNTNSFNLDEIRRAVRDQLAEVLGIRLFTLFLYDHDTRILRLFAHNHPQLRDDLRIRFTDGNLMFDAMQKRQAIYEADFAKSSYYHGRLRKKYMSPFALCVPLQVGIGSIGVLNVNDHPQGYLTDKDTSSIRQVADHLASAISNATSHSQLERLSYLDGLTETYNHRHLHTLLDTEYKKARRYGRPVSFLMIDLDNFKQVNDRYGHLTGDHVLRETAKIMKSNLRDVDQIARYGGEEFAIILPETPLKGALITAERIRRTVDKNIFKTEQHPIHQTISLGVVSYPEIKADTKDELIRLADLAMYEAKQTGKNRVVRFQERRLYTRLTTEGRMVWQATRQSSPGQALLKNISPAGLNLYIPSSVRVGREVSCDLLLPHDAKMISLRGKLVWCQEAGDHAPGYYEVGIRFHEFSKRISDKLHVLEITSVRKVSGKVQVAAS
ncbi:MAG: diguanylate cyclase [Nitrospirae bacterium]|nr:diguanylate cyclase [Nitrospirota bacterium]